MDSSHDQIVNFRVVRTGRISGLVWLDTNENGRLDDTERPLADVRVVTGSGRDTLTDGNGYFIREGIVIVAKNGVIPDGMVI